MRFSILCSLLLLLSCSEPASKRFSGPVFSPLTPEEDGIDFNNRIEESPRENYLFYQAFYNGAGVGVADLDGDGLEDLVFAGNQVSDRIYQNLGGLQFKDRTPDSWKSDEGWSTGISFLDVDDNGLKDIYICRFLKRDPTERKNRLYLNQGDFQFKEAAQQYGLADEGQSIQATPFDYDLDGDLDLYVINQPPNHSGDRKGIRDSLTYAYTDRLYKNIGGRFIDVTEESGLKNFGYGMSVISSDIDLDGWPDIYVAQDFEEPDLIYINQKDGTFKEVGREMLQHSSNFSMGADIADFNNDGLPDIFTADMVAEDNRRLKTNMSGMNPERFFGLVEKGYGYQYMFNALQLNRGQGRFSEIAQLSGVFATDWSWSVLFQDMDLDGQKDLLVTNGLKRDVRNNDFNIARRKRVDELEAEADEKGLDGIQVNPLELLALSPSEPLSNYAFQQRGELQFENRTTDWGLAEPLLSHGAVFADLDNDGDFDLVMNNMDAPASIMENLTAGHEDRHWLQLSLVGRSTMNARVTLYSDERMQMQELLSSRGYMSTQSERLCFGLGESSVVDSIIIQWPNGTCKRLYDVQSNQTLEVDYRPDGSCSSTSAETNWSPFYPSGGPAHRENAFDDYRTEVLLPHKMSTTGPGLAIGDLDGDGLQEMMLSPAMGKPLAYHTISDTMESRIIDEQALPADAVDVQLFDVEPDGDLDIYLVLGGNEQRSVDADYQDRLYLNNGQGEFDRSAVLPALANHSGSCVRPFDMDRDGDMDLFLAGRQLPGKYPYPADSHILEWTGKEYRVHSTFEGLGMVTDARWTDIDGDGRQDLLITGEWMNIQAIMNTESGFELQTLVPKSRGWWNDILPMDLDGDGDEDYVLGNLGLNIKYKASPEAPFHIFSKDFDQNGTNDIYMAYHQDGSIFPVRGRECSSQQLPFIKKEFPDYASFGEAEVYEVLPDTLGALHYEAQVFRSCFLFRDPNGWRLEPLPIEAQFSVINCSLKGDMDHDGDEDIFLAGNLFDREVETTRSDASFGVLLTKEDDGAWRVLPNSRHGIYAEGDVRDMQWMEWNGKRLLVIARNNRQALYYMDGQVNQ